MLQRCAYVNKPGPSQLVFKRSGRFMVNEEIQALDWKLVLFKPPNGLIALKS
jgi:hypothetical protein